MSKAQDCKNAFLSTELSRNFAMKSELFSSELTRTLLGLCHGFTI